MTGGRRRPRKPANLPRPFLDIYPSFLIWPVVYPSFIWRRVLANRFSQYAKFTQVRSPIWEYQRRPPRQGRRAAIVKGGVKALRARKSRGCRVPGQVANAHGNNKTGDICAQRRRHADRRRRAASTTSDVDGVGTTRRASSRADFRAAEPTLPGASRHPSSSSNALPGALNKRLPQRGRGRRRGQPACDAAQTASRPRATLRDWATARAGTQPLARDGAINEYDSNSFCSGARRC